MTGDLIIRRRRDRFSCKKTIQSADYISPKLLLRRIFASERNSPRTPSWSVSWGSFTNAR